MRMFRRNGATKPANEMRPVTTASTNNAAGCSWNDGRGSHCHRTNPSARLNNLRCMMRKAKPDLAAGNTSENKGAS